MVEQAEVPAQHRPSSAYQRARYVSDDVAEEGEVAQVPDERDGGGYGGDRRVSEAGVGEAAVAGREAVGHDGVEAEGTEGEEEVDGLAGGALLDEAVDEEVDLGAWVNGGEVMSRGGLNERGRDRCDI